MEFLGSGTSSGVPFIGCDCPVCLSGDPHNKRLRSSVLVRGYIAEKLETTVVIDTTPDFRQQMLRSGVKHVDAIVITHHHSDHIAGIDDVRRFNSLQHQVLDCWATPETLFSLNRSFSYIFDHGGQLRYGLPCLNPRTVSIGESFQIGCLRFEALELDHEIISNTGLKITCDGSAILSYCLDVKRISEKSFAALQGTDTLILDMLREKAHPTHMNLDEAMQAVRRIAPRRTFFGHISHEVDHATLAAKLPPEMKLAYDGLIVEMQ